MWSFQLVRALSQCQNGGGQIAECLQAAERIVLGDYESWHHEWMRLGNRALEQAEKAMAESHFETARAAYKRAANYIRSAEFFLQAHDPRKLETYLKGIEAFRKGVAMDENPPEVVQISYEHCYMPAYFYKVEGVSKQPTVIMFGGLDSTAEETYFSIVPYLRERGLAVLTVDGPGQGGALRLNHLVSRPDYEVAGTAALEWALKRDDIDPDRIAIMAWSMGGYMAARMAAFEPRFKACAILGAVYNYSAVWDRRPDNHPLASILQHVLGVSSMPEAREKLKQFTLEGVLHRIKCPTFIIHGEEDRQVLVEHAYRVYEELTCEKRLEIVKAETTGAAHCQADNKAMAFPLFDWLKDKLLS